MGKYKYVWTQEFDKIAFVTIKGMDGIQAIDRLENYLFDVAICDNGPDWIHNGMFRIEKDGKMGIADISGTVVIEPVYDAILPLQENGLVVFCLGGHQEKDGEYTYHRGGRWGVMDRNGKIIIPAIYEEARADQLKKDGQWYTIADGGKLIPDEPSDNSK